MMIRIAFFLILAVSLVTPHDPMKGLLKKYGMKKVFESCFGEAQAKEYYKKIYTSMQDCKAEVDGGVPPSRGTPSRQRPSFDWEGFFEGGNRIRTRSQDNIDYFFNRQKRDVPVPFHEDKVRATKDTFLRNLKIGACVLQKCEVLDSNMQMNWGAIRRQYSEVQGEPELKEDLMEVLNHCQKFVSCYSSGSESNSRNSFPMGIKQALIFMKCEKKKKALACIKQDLRKHPQMFELQGLDGILDGSKYDEMDEQMLKVLLMDQKYGNNDFAMFE